jgi:magnesium transporter
MMNKILSNVVIHKDYSKDIVRVLRSSKSDELIRRKLSKYHENDIADAIKLLDKDTRIRLYKILGVDWTAEIFSYLEDTPEYIEEFMTELSVDEAADVLEKMDADDAVDILDNVSEEERQALISHMEKDAKDDVCLIYSYDDDEIGSKMTTNFICINNKLTIKEAMKELVAQAEENDNVNTIYVVDDNNIYYGAIDLKDLIVARDYQKLEDIISTSYPYVYAHEKMSECIEDLKDYSEDSIPVLNKDKEIIGAITSSDIIEAVDEEMSDDYAKLAGLTEENDLTEGLFASMKKRLPWLILLLLLGMGVSSVVGIFENVVSQLAIIVCFQSLILDMAGNVGTQSLAVTIRVLMDEDISAKQKLEFVLKEMRIGFANGLLLGSMAFILLGIYITLVKGKPVHYAFAISGCVGVSLLLAMLISSLIGVLTPMFFHKIKIDPAVASGPLITTINDLVAVVTYYGLAAVVLIGMLHITG